ncbi:hypothetical protein F441_22554, partial [Phytophthora nicotianae CJ01A1]
MLCTRSRRNIGPIHWSQLWKFMGPSKRKQRFQGNRGDTPKRRQPSRATGNTDTDVTSASLAFDRAVFGAVWRYLRKE